MPRNKTWKCIRVSKGVVCGARNPSRVRKCSVCRKWRPKRPVPKHRKILDRPYEEWAELYGEVCNICGKKNGPHRRLDRDHCHTTGLSRGLCCARCNRNLRGWMTPEWLESAAAYLRRDLHL